MSRKSPKPREDFIPILKDWTHSCFYVKLHDAQQKDNELAPFLTAITDIVTQAKSISAQVVRYFPQYTDHGEIHLKNVLSYMSWMAEESITDWHPVECGIAILAAYVHDLGMVPTEDEKVFLEADDPDLTKLTPEHRRRALAWFRFRDEDPMWRRYQADKRRSDCRTLALANFLRNSHASVTYTEGKARIEEHLRVIAQVTQNGESFFSANGFPWLQGLVLLCLSHNADVKFIERSLSQCSYINLIKAHEQMLSRHGLHEIHWPRISWALRLADVIDMDASRTPSILLNTITEPESLIQWKKHYCIGKFKISESKRNQSQLIYFVGKCPDAETEHALREMVGYTDENQRIFSSGWINEELQNVLAAQDRYGAGRSPLRLPEIAYADISERKDNYEYEELVFKLQRESVMGLFMGEALYGSPDICLRELVQNALDAIHLRELFWKWHVGNLDLPTDSQNAIVPNVKTTQGEKLCVEVRWGEEEVHRGTEQKKMRFIEVRDTGVGMSLEALKRYLTQVGQSYYTSRTFAEQRYEMLHNHGLVCTPISQFGIGFLAIFMLTDHVEIITCTADQKWKIDIHGPHSFMKLTPLTTGGPKRTGTWVKIWVKDGIEFEPFNWASFIDRLRCYFYAADKGYSPADNTIEPAWAIARSVVWPLHPVVLFPPSSNGVPYRDGVPIDGVPLEMKDGISLDGDFHARYLLLSPELKPNVLRPWFDRESKPRTWNHRDWTDGPDSDQQNPLRIPTGSRVRVLLLSTEEAFQQAVGTSVPPVPTNLAEELIEALPFHPKRRSFVLINGLYLTNGHELLPWSNIEPGFGSIVWLDLRGDAALKLRADRKDIVQDQSKVREPAAHVQDLWFDWWKFDQDWKNIAIWCDGAQRRKADHAIEWAPATVHQRKGWHWPRYISEAILSEATIRPQCSKQPQLKGRRSQMRDHAFAFNFVKRLTPGRIPPSEPQRLSQYYLAALNDLKEGELKGVLGSIKELFPGQDSWEHFVQSEQMRQTSDEPHVKSWSNFVDTLFFQEAFHYPEGGTSFPLIGRTPNLSNPHLSLRGSMHIQSHDKDNNAPVLPFDHDLVAPLTGIPLNGLLRSCRFWKSRRLWRLLFLLPFYLGCVPKSWRSKEKVIIDALGQAKSVSLYIPGEEFLYSDWKGSERETKGHTLYWDVEQNRVLWLSGSAAKNRFQDGQGMPLIPSVLIEG